MTAKFERGTSRRTLLKTGAGLAAGAAAMPGLASAQPAGPDATLDRLTGANPNTRRILLKGGTIISMDPAVGDFAQGDILIEGQKIAAVARAIDGPGQDGNAIVVDAKDTVVIPGMVDCHRAHHVLQALRYAESTCPANRDAFMSGEVCIVARRVRRSSARRDRSLASPLASDMNCSSVSATSSRRPIVERRLSPARLGGVWP